MYSEVDLHACGISWVDLNFPNASYRGTAGIADFRAGLQAAGILEKGVEGGVTGGQGTREEDERHNQQSSSHQNK